METNGFVLVLKWTTWQRCRIIGPPPPGNLAWLLYMSFSNVLLSFSFTHSWSGKVNVNLARSTTSCSLLESVESVPSSPQDRSLQIELPTSPLFFNTSFYNTPSPLLTPSLNFDPNFDFYFDLDFHSRLLSGTRNILLEIRGARKCTTSITSKCSAIDFSITVCYEKERVS